MKMKIFILYLKTNMNNSNRKTCKKIDCINNQVYKEGGKRGFCIKHGGFPFCKEKSCIFTSDFVNGYCVIHSNSFNVL